MNKEIIARTCADCGIEFKVASKDEQKYCFFCGKQRIKGGAPCRVEIQKNTENVSADGAKRNNLTLNGEKNKPPFRESITTKKPPESKKPNIAPTTRRKSMQPNEHTTSETEKTNLEKSSPTVENETPSSDSTALSNVISEERSSSIELLNNSANHLLDLAKSMSAPRNDDCGAQIQRAQNFQVETSIKCLQELRGIMKTKLEYLKFARETGGLSAKK